MKIFANISKFLFWKRITTYVQHYTNPIILLQIYQSSFFESESQQIMYFTRGIYYCCKYIKVPFLKANHNSFLFRLFLYLIVANISKFLFWKRITTDTANWNRIRQLLKIYQSSFFESESQLFYLCIWGQLHCCKYIKVPFLKANHNKIQV